MKRNGITVMARLIGLVKPLTGYMLLAILMGLIGHLCATFITVLGGYALLDILEIPTRVSMKAAFICVAVFALVRGLLRYAEQACNHFIAFKLLALIRDKVFLALRKLCPAKLEGKDKGNLISVITSDIELLEVFYAHTISPAAIAMLYSVVMCLFLGSFHIAFAGIGVAAYLTIGIVVPLVISKLGGEDGARFRRQSGQLSGFVLDSLRGLNEIIQYGRGAQRLEEMNAQSDALSEAEHRMKRNTGRNGAVTNAAILVFDIAMLLCGVFLYLQGAVSFAGLLIPVLALMASFGPCVALANLGSTLQSTFAAGDRVLDILEEEPLVEDVCGRTETAFAGAEVSSIGFAYGDEAILRDFSVNLPQDKVIGIVGKSSSGKSTLLKLLMRFWHVQQGEISVSGRNIEDINTQNLRDMESFVTQETHLFHDSIKNNLRIAKLDATDEEIENACKKASVHDFIMSLPKGYDTAVGDGGGHLSGGEKQRISIARAMLKNADIIILDEATAYTDPENEAVIQRAVSKLVKGKTLLVIAHRLSTIINSDCIFVIEDGNLTGQGKHEELLGTHSTYRTMWEAHIQIRDKEVLTNA